MEEVIITILAYIIFCFLVEKLTHYFLKESLIKLYYCEMEEKAMKIEDYLQKCKEATNYNDYVLNVFLLETEQRYFSYYLGVLHGYGDKESEKYEKYLHQHTELRYFNN